MSRSMDDVLLRLDADAWVLTSRGLVSRHEFEAAPGPALDDLVLDASSRGRLRAVFCDAWLRYLVVHWPRGLRRADERGAYVEHRFNAVHGIGAPDWQVTVDRNSLAGSSLACAAPSALIARVQGFAASHKLRLVGVTGDFIDRYDRMRTAFCEPRGTRAALAVAKRGRVTVGSWCDGQWLMIRSRALRDDDMNGLSLMLDMEVHGTEPGGFLYVDGMSVPALAGWRVVQMGQNA